MQHSPISKPPISKPLIAKPTPLAPTGGASPGSTAILTALLEARSGQQMANYRLWRIDTALKPLLRDRGMETLDELVAVLLHGDDRKIGDQIIDALLNNETSFFRDSAVFDAILEATVALEAEGTRPRIWCAGCATGQEPLSLAMMFAERQEATGTPAPELIATDLSDTALTRARSGQYSQFEIQRGLPVRRMIRWFDAVGGDWVAKPELVRMIAYRRLNLIADPMPAGGFDLVLCRNVLIYLSPTLKGDVLARLAAALKPDGSLVLGAGETVIGHTESLAPSRRFRGFYDAASVRAVA